MWNDVTDDWLSVSTWFGTCSAPTGRMQERGLVYSLFVAHTMWFGMPDICRVKGEWVEHGIKRHEVRDSNNKNKTTKILLSRGTILDRWNWSVFHCLLGHLNVSSENRVKHCGPDIKFLLQNHGHNNLP